jgi:hypothetical protein
MTLYCHPYLIFKILLLGRLPDKANLILHEEVVCFTPGLIELNSNLTMKKSVPEDLKCALLKIVNKYSNSFNLTSPLKKFSNTRSAFLDSICHGSLRVDKN